MPSEQLSNEAYDSVTHHKVFVDSNSEENLAAHLENARKFAADNLDDLKDMALAEATAAGKKIVNLAPEAASNVHLATPEEVEAIAPPIIEVHHHRDLETIENMELQKGETVSYQLFDIAYDKNHPDRQGIRHFEPIGLYESVYGNAEREDLDRVGSFRLVAHIQAGDPRSSMRDGLAAEVRICESKTGEKFAILQSHNNDDDRDMIHIEWLTPNKRFDVGRSGPLEPGISGLVSGKHFTTWVDDEGKLFVQNHTPINPTVTTRL